MTHLRQNSKGIVRFFLVNVNEQILSVKGIKFGVIYNTLRWTELVADRKKWIDTVRQAKAHSGM